MVPVGRSPHLEKQGCNLALNRTCGNLPISFSCSWKMFQRSWLPFIKIILLGLSPLSFLGNKPCFQVWPMTINSHLLIRCSVDISPGSFCLRPVFQIFGSILCSTKKFKEDNSSWGLLWNWQRDWMRMTHLSCLPGTASMLGRWDFQC